MENTKGADEDSLESIEFLTEDNSAENLTKGIFTFRVTGASFEDDEVGQLKAEIKAKTELIQRQGVEIEKLKYELRIQKRQGAEVEK